MTKSQSNEMITLHETHEEETARQQNLTELLFQKKKSVFSATYKQEHCSERAVRMRRAKPITRVYTLWDD